MEEIWGINLRIENNTDFVVQIANAELDTFVVESLSVLEWTEIIKTLSLTLTFKDENDNNVMVGTLVYNSTDGVIVNRGDLNEQTISMVIFVNGENEFNETQISNGAVTVCTWDDIIGGGNIGLSFNNVI
jgi:hypothetical protein